MRLVIIAVFSLFVVALVAGSGRAATAAPITGDHINAPLTWKGSHALGGLRGRTVWLHVELFKADLYAIRFA